MDKRRKISYYLNPEENRGDKFVCNKLETLSKSEKSRLLRAATLTGFALLLQENRIPYMIAELLDENTTLNEIIQIINSALPGAIYSPSDKKEVIERKKNSENSEDEEITRINARNMFTL